MNPTPEPWEEEFDSLYGDTLNFEVCCSGRECACNAETAHVNIKSFIRTLRTAAYEQGKREGEAAKDEAVRETKTLIRAEGYQEGYDQGMKHPYKIERERIQAVARAEARQDLLTALKAVLGEKLEGESYGNETGIPPVFAGGYNSLHATITRFIKEQEEL